MRATTAPAASHPARGSGRRDGTLRPRNPSWLKEHRPWPGLIFQCSRHGPARCCVARPSVHGVQVRAADREIRRTGSVALVRSATLSRGEQRVCRLAASRAARRLAPSARAGGKRKSVPLPPPCRRGTVSRFTPAGAAPAQPPRRRPAAARGHRTPRRDRMCCVTMPHVTSSAPHATDRADRRRRQGLHHPGRLDPVADRRAWSGVATPTERRAPPLELAHSATRPGGLCRRVDMRPSHGCGSETMLRTTTSSLPYRVRARQSGGCCAGCGVPGR